MILPLGLDPLSTGLLLMQWTSGGLVPGSFQGGSRSGPSGTRSQQGVFPEHMTLYHLIGADKLMEAPEEEG